MILSAEEIREAIQKGDIIIAPSPNDDQYSSSSLDLRLGSEFVYWDPEKTSQPGTLVEITPSRADFSRFADTYSTPFPRQADGSVVLEPGDFVLAITLERVELPLVSAIAARVEGRSTLARWGLQVHLTAPTIHAGWSGQITLELLNHGPFKLRLTEGDRVCQLVFERLGQASGQPPGTQFLGQRSPTGR